MKSEEMTLTIDKFPRIKNKPQLYYIPKLTE